MSGRCPTGWPHDSHTATLISVPPLWVCTLVLTRCINCGLHRRLCTSSVVLQKQNKKLRKTNLTGAVPRLCTSTGEHLWTPGAWPCLQAPLPAGSRVRRVATVGGKKVVRAVWHSTYRFSHSWNKLSEISSRETDTCFNCHCTVFHGGREMNPWTSKVHIPTVPSKNPIVSKGNFLKVKELQTLAHEALPQAGPGLWAQGSQWNIFLAVVPGKKADI